MAEREKLFEPDLFNEMSSWLDDPEFKEQRELIEMLSIAGQTIYEWEQQNGRFPVYMEPGNEDFYLEHVPLACTIHTLIYDRGLALPMSTLIRAAI